MTTIWNKLLRLSGLVTLGVTLTSCTDLNTYSPNGYSSSTYPRARSHTTFGVGYGSYGYAPRYYGTSPYYRRPVVYTACRACGHRTCRCSHSRRRPHDSRDRHAHRGHHHDRQDRDRNHRGDRRVREERGSSRSEELSRVNRMSRERQSLQRAAAVSRRPEWVERRPEPVQGRPERVSRQQGRDVSFRNHTGPTQRKKQGPVNHKAL